MKIQLKISLSRIPFVKRYAASSFFKNILSLSGGTAASQFLLIISTPILTRLYIPSDFGVLAVFLSLLSILGIASSLRYEIAIPLPKLDKHAAYLVVLSITITLFTSCITFLAIYFWDDEISTYVNTPDINNYLWLLPLGIFFLGVYKIFTFWAIRRQSYKAIAKTKIIQSVITISLQAIAGFLSIGAMGLIAGRLAGQCMGILTLTQDVSLYKIVFTTKKLHFRLLALAKLYKDFLKYDVIAAIIDTLNLQLPPIFLTIVFGPVIAGHYMLVERVLSMPSSLIGNSAGQVFYGNWNKSTTEGTTIVLTMNIIRNLSLIILLPTILIFFSGKFIFPFVFGPKWFEAGIFATWMIFGIALQFIYSPISLALMALNEQKVNLFINILLLLCKSAGGIMGYLLQNSLLTVQIFSFSSLLIYGFGILLIFNKVKQHSAQRQ